VELTNQHKILLALVGLGIGTVILDRVVLGTGVSDPASASAGTSDQASTQRGEVSLAEVQRATIASKIEQLPQKLPDDARVSEAFRARADWFAGSNQAKIVDAGSAKSVSTAFRLSSVMTKPVAAAVINGQLLRTGQDYAFAANNSGIMQLLKDEDAAARRRSNPASVRVVRLESVEARVSGSPGAAVLIVDGTDRHELVIEASDKASGTR